MSLVTCVAVLVVAGLALRSWCPSVFAAARFQPGAALWALDAYGVLLAWGTRAQRAASYLLTVVVDPLGRADAAIAVHGRCHYDTFRVVGADDPSLRRAIAWFYRGNDAPATHNWEEHFGQRPSHTLRFSSPRAPADLVVRVEFGDGHVALGTRLPAPHSLLTYPVVVRCRYGIGTLCPDRIAETVRTRAGQHAEAAYAEWLEARGP